MGWANIYRRRMKVFTACFIMYLDYKALQKRQKWISESKRAALWGKVHQRNAKRVLCLIVELEGLWVKLGQYLSTRADVLPEAYISLLRQLQDSLPPRPLKEVCWTIEKELGKSMDELFKDFNNVPLATASIAQVHRATLSDGQDVVVKVQHEGIKIVILEDLKNAKSMVDWIVWAEPQFDFKPMIDEWCKESPKELDFNHEAENTKAVSKNLGCKWKCDDNLANQVHVLIPEVIQSTEKVLILEYMDGIRLNDTQSLDAFGIDKQHVVNEITRAYAHQIYVDGFFNGDPHPGNFLISKNPPHCPILLDFGLTKLISNSLKQSLAKMFLAAAEGDHVALLSSFAEMGLKLRLDVPEQAMQVTGAFFRNSTPTNEALGTIRTLNDKRTQNMKVVQEKMKLSEKEAKRFNPIDAFPGDIVIFTRVLNLLRGLTSIMNCRVVYLDIMRPFAESVLKGSMNTPTVNSEWIYNTPVHSDVEAKLRQLLIDLGNDGKILGIQVSAYKDGKVLIDTSAGVLGRYDPRPVQPDSLFPIFSVTKGITAGLLHWLVDTGKLKLEEKVANIWPEFGSNNKDLIKVHHVLNHTSGLHNALADALKENPLILSDWNECLNHITMSVSETEPGHEQLYHYLSFGWLCGGIIEHASGKKFQEVLEEAFIHPIGIDGELYIGIPPGVEYRLASLTLDKHDFVQLSNRSSWPELPSSFQPDHIIEMATILPTIFNTLHVRRAIIPSANGHCSARALARYYATLVNRGAVPPTHSCLSKPLLGKHTHKPTFPSKKSSKNIPKVENGKKQNCAEDSGSGSNGVNTNVDSDSVGKVFNNPRIHDAFLGVGEYENMAFPDGKFGLGFMRFCLKDGSMCGFGHSGMGGSTGYCDIENRLSIAITVNKMSCGIMTEKIIQFICSELNIPLAEGIYEQSTPERAVIN